MLTILSKRALCLNKNIKKINISFTCYSSNIIRSRFPDIVIPDVTLPEYIFSNFNKFPNKIAVECAETGRKYTFEELRRKSINLNKALRKVLKLKHDDIIAVILPNVPEYPICILGSLLANLKVTTVNPAGTVDEIKRQMIDTDTKAIFTVCSLENHIRQVIRTLPAPVPIITIKTKTTDTTPEGFINFSELLDVSFAIDDKYLAKTNDIAIIPYSSGTTGLQKGVLHSHSSLVSLICQLRSPYVVFTKPTTENFQETLPVVLPFFHIYGFTSLLITQLSIMSKIVTLSKFTPEIFVNVLEKHKPRLLCVVPPLFLFLTNSPLVTQKHLKSVEYVFSGAAPLGPKDEERLVIKSEEKLQVVQGYGLTEAPVVTVNSNNDHYTAGTVGKPLQNTEIKVVSVENALAEPLAKNEEGEIFVRGPQVMCGYYNNPKETESTFVNGWLRTGDLGYYDEYNNVYIKDRLKELIKVKGYQVAPAELEDLIRSYPNVTDAVVIGIPHEKYGEVPRAYITLKPKTNINLKSLEEFVSSNVSTYKQIQGGFSIVDSIPKTASGKYLRKDLKVQYLKNNM
ncbi:hypothetical protein RN001_003366 [Aquatica leii]|uniref:Uncharacterized protein n=1 Tax=Aquatica leii TaxID=1421715 RepID=A0AAN7PEX4_9COLE|nr:hypothetical protein RN001_003366 [Aquatica leii]